MHERYEKNTYFFLYENLKKETDGFRCTYKNNIKMDLKEI
jgi:hypothetical protein